MSDKLKIVVTEQGDWADDEAVLGLQTAPKEGPAPAELRPLGHAGRDAQHLDPLGDDVVDDRA